MTIFEVTSCIFVLKCFDSSNSLVPFPFLLHNYVTRYIIIQWVNCEAMNNSHHDKMINSDNLVTLLSSFWFILFHYIASYYTHSFLSPSFCLNVFLHSFPGLMFEKFNIDDQVTFWEKWKNLQNWRILSIISFIKWSIIVWYSWVSYKNRNSEIHLFTLRKASQ